MRTVLAPYHLDCINGRSMVDVVLLHNIAIFVCVLQALILPDRFIKRIRINQPHFLSFHNKPMYKAHAAMKASAAAIQTQKSRMSIF